MDTVREMGAREFPLLLREIPDPPKKLYYTGRLPDPDLVPLCVVGSRKFSAYGKMACERILGGLAGYPVSIISGLALGIDAIAHQTALAVGLHTVAIPGSGLSPKALYPAAHRSLAHRILASGGTLMSPFEPDFRAAVWGFPARNRIMAGMSKATLIIEAEERSGTLITARLALDYNREVFAVPGSIFSPTSRGTNALIRDGAAPVTEPADLISLLGFSLREDFKKSDARPPDLSPDELLVWERLDAPRTRDELNSLTNISAPLLNTILSRLELSGAIKESGGVWQRS